MNPRSQLLIVDPIDFAGGSKVATRHALKAWRRTDDGRITVLSRDRESWPESYCRLVPLREPRWLRHQEQGIAYFLRHLIILLNILFVRFRFGRFDVGLGASGPGVDLALIWYSRLSGMPMIQLIHGPVAASRTIARGLLRAFRIFYLPSQRQSIHDALALLQPSSSVDQLLESERFSPFVNAIPDTDWPTPARRDATSLLWAASLLRWKGLDLLLSALDRIPVSQRPDSHVCYIRPRHSKLEMSQAPVLMAGVAWHEAPDNLDAIRTDCGMFVSTSEREPFGMSILEAMAASLAVLVPRDGAYWDQVLVDGVECIKYEPGNAVDLAEKIRDLAAAPNTMHAIGNMAARRACEYRDSQAYEGIVQSLHDACQARTGVACPEPGR